MSALLSTKILPQDNKAEEDLIVRIEILLPVFIRFTKSYFSSFQDQLGSPDSTTSGRHNVQAESATPQPTRSAASVPAANGSATQSIATESRRPSRMSISTDVMPGNRMRQRRKAVEISDQKACVLLHTRLKGMKLEDIA